MTSDPFLLALLVVLSLTAFVKIATTLTVFRYGVGLHGIEFGVVTLLISIVVSATTLPPTLRSFELHDLGKKFSSTEDVQRLFDSVSPDIAAKTDSSVLAVFERRDSASHAQVMAEKKSSFLHVQLPAFLVSEVKYALTLGVTLLIPFLLVDLLVAHILALVGAQQIAAATVALPVKLAVFLSVNGWELLVGKLVA